MPSSNKSTEPSARKTKEPSAGKSKEPSARKTKEPSADKSKESSVAARVDIEQLIASYHAIQPDPSDKSQRVSFGTSGHRGTALAGSFNGSHILAIAQAIVDYRQLAGIEGPAYLGMDTHALSEPALHNVIEVFVANGVECRIQKDGGYTPTPVISHAILTHNKGLYEQPSQLSDGVIITPSHNPPEDGGIKYNPPNGGPADTDITSRIADKANAYLESGLESVKRLAYEQACNSDLVVEFDYIEHYVSQLDQVVDMKAIKKAKIRIGVDPMGGSGIHFWKPIAKRYGLNIEVVNSIIDPTFAFMPLDKDGKIRMDCSSPYAMANLLELQDKFDIAVGNDPDYDRHGIVCPNHGLMNPNAYLAVAIDYLCKHRPEWSSSSAIGKTLVSSAMIDKVVEDNQRELKEMPVGFKWYVEGLFKGDLLFGGEESAGASFLRRNGEVWSTDKDGFILDLLAAEILAVTGKTPAEYYSELTEKFGESHYRRLDKPATNEQKQALLSIDVSELSIDTLAGEEVQSVLSEAPGNHKAIGGIKIITKNAWFAARPSGTENVYKIYLESLKSSKQLAKVEKEAVELVDQIFEKAR